MNALANPGQYLLAVATTPGYYDIRKKQKAEAKAKQGRFNKNAWKQAYAKLGMEPPKWYEGVPSWAAIGGLVVGGPMGAAAGYLLTRGGIEVVKAARK